MICVYHLHYVYDDLFLPDDEMASLGNELFSICFLFLLNENGGVVAAEELLVMVGNVLEPAAAEVAEAEKIRKEIHFAMTLFRHLGKVSYQTHMVDKNYTTLFNHGRKMLVTYRA